LCPAVNMADPIPPPAPTPGAAPAPSPASTASSAPTASTYKAAERNPALRMMGIPGLPKKLPSRNWLIFWALTASFTGAIIYDKREKKRATARWSKSVSHLGKELITNPNQLPRRLTVFLESPPNDGLRVAQDHYTEYVKPILAASGLDWDFVQGRAEGDVRAAVAEKIRRTRRLSEDPNPTPDDAQAPTGEEIVKAIRQRNGTPEYIGIHGDIVVGRHTWKEYIRGLHEGWLGPLNAPPIPEKPKSEFATLESDEGEKKEDKPEEEPAAKPERPPQPEPFNSTNDYPTSSLPMMIPSEFSPSTEIRFPHVLGFSSTFVRLGRFLTRRHLADEIGREVAAVCLAHAREYREDASAVDSEQQVALQEEERDWPKSVWKEGKPVEKPEIKVGDELKADEETPAAPAEKIWASPVVMDPRISMRMRRFELQAEDEARAKAIVVPEEEVEGWIKGSFRSLYRWAVSGPQPKPYYWADE
jgi:import inner membrane translocase subunit TIM54